MKLVITTSLISCAAAFVPSTYSPKTVSLKDAADTVAISPEPTVPVTPVLPKMSQSLPFLARPAALTGELAGDVGFDPLGFAKNSEELMNFREAEIKHARLAMLAAAGWPISEVLDKKIACKFNFVCIFLADSLLGLIRRLLKIHIYLSCLWFDTHLGR